MKTKRFASYLEAYNYGRNLTGMLPVNSAVPNHPVVWRKESKQFDASEIARLTLYDADSKEPWMVRIADCGHL